jgi:hypothetical protein
MVRTTFPLAVVLCLAVSLLMFSGSGFNALVDGSQSAGPVGDALGEQANESAVQDGNISVSRSASDEGSVAGLILGGSKTAFQIFNLLAFLPFTMQRLGFPTWFALPIASLVYVLVGLGIAQFVSGRIYQ